jgi:hypothetical protein
MRESAAPDQSDFDDLARRLRGVHDVGLRGGAARLSLLRLDGPRLADLVASALSAVASGHPTGQDVLAALGAALEPAEWDGLRARAALAAVATGAPLAACYLAPRAGAAQDAQHQPVPDFGAGRPLTLGERKSVARGQNRDVIARVLRDPDPAVIAILLGNPALVEAQVVRLTARRPVPSAVLREVYRSPRWSTRHAVRLALAQNPWCALEVSVRVAALLNVSERRSIANSPELPSELRAFCAGLLLPVEAGRAG